MRISRATVLAIIVAVALLSGGTLTAAAASGGLPVTPDAATAIDPGDPGLPPDD